jgi:hypothetical protein
MIDSQGWHKAQECELRIKPAKHGTIQPIGQM